MKIHPNESALQDLFRQQDGGTLRMLEHVLGCPACRERAQGLLASWRQSEPSKLLRLPAASQDYDQIFESAARALHSQKLSLDQERQEARALFPSLEACPPERQRLLLENSRRYQTWGMLELLLERSQQARFDDSHQVEHWAELALSLLGRLDGEPYGTATLQDMRARAWSYIGNARRIRSELPEAEAAFEVAFSHLRNGTGDPVERALILDLKASLRKIQRRFEEATALMERAICIFRESGEKHRTGKGLIQLATIHEHAGRHGAGIPLLIEALDLLDPKREPHLLLIAQHNLYFMLTEIGRHFEARRFFHQAKLFYEQFPQPWAQSRRSWIVAKIARQDGRFEEAEKNLLEARGGFVVGGALYDAALVSLELASLYKEQRRTDEIKPLAEEVISYFGSLQINREVQRAMDLLQAAEGGIA